MGSKGNKCCCDNEVIRDPCFDGLGFTLAMESTCFAFCNGADEVDLETYYEEILNDGSVQFGIGCCANNNCTWYSEPRYVGTQSCASMNDLYLMWEVDIDQNGVLTLQYRVKTCFGTPADCRFGAISYRAIWQVDTTGWNGTDDLTLTPYDVISSLSDLGCGRDEIGDITLTPVYP